MIQRTFSLGRDLLAAVIALCSAITPAAAQMNPNFEYGIDRRGGDYRSFDLNFDAPGLCAGQCAQEEQCRAWTYVKPGVQGPKARCWLKNVVPAPTRDGNVVSGLRGTVAPPVATPPVQAARYVGCFKDTSVFDLNGYLERSAQNTPQRCLATCRARGFAYAGVQYGQSCLCGNSFGRYGAAAPGTCNMACTGDRGQAGGGYNTNSVYATGLVATPPPVVGQPSPPPPAPPVAQRPPAGDCWAASPTFVEQLEGAGNWRGVYTRRGSSNVFDALYTRGSETGPDVLTLERSGNTVTVKRSAYAAVLTSTIGGDGVARGMYGGGTRFTLTCGAR